jgi:hypothetical protein
LAALLLFAEVLPADALGEVIGNIGFMVDDDAFNSSLARGGDVGDRELILCSLSITVDAQRTVLRGFLGFLSPRTSAED